MRKFLALCITIVALVLIREGFTYGPGGLIPVGALMIGFAALSVSRPIQER